MYSRRKEGAEEACVSRRVAVWPDAVHHHQVRQAEDRGAQTDRQAGPQAHARTSVWLAPAARKRGVSQWCDAASVADGSTPSNSTSIRSVRRSPLVAAQWIAEVEAAAAAAAAAAAVVGAAACILACFLLA